MNEKKKSLGARIGNIIGQVLATTIVICAWLIIIAFTMKCLWSCEKIQRLQRLHFVSKMAM